MMTQEMQAKLKRSLVLHEGRKNFPYDDGLGNITIGIGYNLTARGLSDEWVDTQYNQDVAYFYNRLMDDFFWFKDLNIDRQIVLVDMCFMGYKKFLSFKKMLGFLAESDYKNTAKEMLDSEWAKQTKGRAEKLACAMEEGEYHV